MHQEEAAHVEAAADSSGKGRGKEVGCLQHMARSQKAPTKIVNNGKQAKRAPSAVPTLPPPALHLSQENIDSAKKKKKQKNKKKKKKLLLDKRETKSQKKLICR